MSRVGLGAVLALAAVACGGRTASAPPTETAVPDSAQAVAAPPPAIVPQVLPIADAPAVRPVEFQRLVALLPVVEGWSRTDDHAEQIAGPVPAARAEAKYERAGVHVELALADSARDPLRLSPLAVFLAPGYSERFGDEFRRAVQIDGQPGFEEWQEPARRATVTLVVAGRFIVRAAGYGVRGLAPVTRLVRAVDVRALAALR
ncbi:MAG: hypothetical protein IT184_04620 [Acidobacteria bacterium]|nr:hypothetical protein [Acidobacteriota bacterium]